ncbi:MAG: carbohydrate-binding domain-containing protein [Clostridia bacterium]|nr:carbohydrate-binding domain-containing protein [Clostridia bacterium]
MLRMTALLLVLCLLCGCGAKNPQPQSPEPTASPAVTPMTETLPESELLSDRDRDPAYSAEGAVEIKLQGNSAACASDAVEIRGTTVTILDEGTYILSGKLDDGQIIVAAGDTDKTQIVLSGAEIASAKSAALYIRSADKVFVTLAEGSENSLKNGGSFAAQDESNIDGALFSESDLTVNGTGSLTVSSPAGHGVVCKDDLVLAQGRLRITAAAHAIDANDSVTLSEANLTLTAGKDGIHAENAEDTALGNVYLLGGEAKISAAGDGISAGGSMQISGGSFAITSGGGSGNAAVTADEDASAKGLKSAGNLQISGGSFAIDAADDGVHANQSISMTGASFDISTGDDGFHADERLDIGGGKITIRESYEGLEGLHIAITGGEISLTATDDGLNAAGGNDGSGMGGMRPGGDKFGGRGGMGGGPGGMGGMGGMGTSASSGSITISGGRLDIIASGDGIDANGTLSITGGYTTVTGPTRGDTATLDYDLSAVITGGTFIGTGASGMAQTFSSSENQGVIAVSVGQQRENTTITVTDSAGKTVVSHTPAMSFAVVILSTPEIRSGESYTVTVGELNGEIAAS